MRSAVRPVPQQSPRELILRGAESLGVLGGAGHAAPQLIAMLCRGNVNASEVAALVEREPALYARVLRVANSPFYGCRTTIRTLQQAIVLLGLDAVRGIAAAACLDRQLMRDRETTALDLKALVVHSLATAIAAEALARLRAPALAADAFIAGLLHNLGVAVQLHVDGAGVRELVERRRVDPTADLRSGELECIAVGHEECVATVFEAWGFPCALVESARHHHRPGGAADAHRELAALVSLGANLGVRSGHAFVLEPAPVPPDPDALRLLAMDEAELARLVAELPERVSALSQALLEG